MVWLLFAFVFSFGFIDASIEFLYYCGSCVLMVSLYNPGSGCSCRFCLPPYRIGGSGDGLVQLTFSCLSFRLLLSLYAPIVGFVSIVMVSFHALGFCDLVGFTSVLLFRLNHSVRWV